MQVYRFVFGDGSGTTDTLELEAADLSTALRLADEKIGERPAEIWNDGRRLTRIQKVRSYSGLFWQVS